MAGRGGPNKLVVWAASGLVVIASAAAMVWIWRGGGVTLQPAAEARASVEECNAAVSGSTAMTLKLAPRVTAAFLRQSGYTVEEGALSPEGVRRVVGTRGALRCTVEIRTTSSTQGLHDLAERKTLVALSQRPATVADIAMLRAAGAGDFAIERPRAEHVVAFDAYGIAVNTANTARNINYDALREIVFGQKMNWSELGGADAPITLYGVRDGTGPEDYPNDLVQNANPVWINAAARGTILDNEEQLVAAVSRDPNAFAFVSVAFVPDAPNVRAMAIAFAGSPREATIANVLNETYPMTRRLFVYVRPGDMNSNSFVRRFVTFFKSPAAFDLIDQAGFAALRPTSRISGVAGNLSGCRFGTAEYASLMSATNGASRLPVEMHFVPSTVRLDPEARHFVEESATDMRGKLREGSRVILIGHTDYTGDTAKNRALALRRALAVRNAFEARGVLGIEIESAGEVCPRGDNDTAEGRERNRRVELWIRPQRQG